MGVGRDLDKSGGKDRADRRFGGGIRRRQSIDILHIDRTFSRDSSFFSFLDFFPSFSFFLLLVLLAMDEDTYIHTHTQYGSERAYTCRPLALAFYNCFGRSEREQNW